MTSVRYTLGVFLLAAVALAFAGCDGIADLDVPNENAPNAEQAITDASDLKSVLAGGYTSWWAGTYENTPQSVPGPHLDGWGDAMTTTNAFRGFWSVATDEPRVEFQNTLSFSDLVIVESPWQNLNAAVSSANDVIGQIENNDFRVVIDGNNQTQMTLAAAYFLRGISYGHLANYFNQAYVTTADFNPEDDLEGLEFSQYPAVLQQARSDLQRAREIAQNNSFTMDNFLPFTETVTSQRLARMSRSFEARFVISNARTPQEESNINWQEIKSLTENGIQESIVMQLDGNTWFNNYQYISGLYWYWRVDNRIIHLMDDDYPIKYPENRAGSGIPPAESEDARLCPTPSTVGNSSISYDGGDGIAVARQEDCYFVYDKNQSFFRIPRGPRLQSNYFYGRDYVDQQWNQTPFAAGPGPIMLAAEDSLMEAEAELELGNKQAAIDIINDGSRVYAGELPELPSSASVEQVRETIEYERDIELYRTGQGLAFYDMRRRGELQEGTPLHLPVPATELQTVGQELYTFGGVNNAGQPGTASGENAWCDQGNLSCDGPFEAPEGTVPGSNAKGSAVVGGSPYQPPTK